MADAVVIGAGHNGLACACYLARAGLRVAVFEAYPSIGGMTLTEELAAPGFRSDVHASGYQLASLSPAPHELHLFDHGLELLQPEYAWAHAFDDGGCIAVGSDLERVRDSIAPYSSRDADTAVDLFKRYRAERDQVVRSLFSPPEPLSTAMRRMEDSPGGLDRYRFSLQSMRSWCDETFESEEVKCLFGAFASFVGHAPDDAAGPRSAGCSRASSKPTATSSSEAACTRSRWPWQRSWKHSAARSERAPLWSGSRSSPVEREP
jgi:beta-carotene ketolase (CrtO type)